jgi:hypothetical protein
MDLGNREEYKNILDVIIDKVIFVLKLKDEFSRGKCVKYSSQRWWIKSQLCTATAAFFIFSYVRF